MKFMVHVIAYNKLEVIIQNMEEKDAKEKYIELCKSWYDEDGFSNFILKNEDYKKLPINEQYDLYFNTEQYQDADDNANVTMDWS